MSKILLVDDDANVLSALQRALRLMWHDGQPHIETFTNPIDALNRICVCDFDLVISDFMMPQLSGAELLAALSEVAPNTVRIMLSASNDFDTVLSSINQAQAFRFMRKPWEPAELEQNVRLALAYRASLLPDTRSAAQLEAARLEADEPGILNVRRDADGAIYL